MEAQLQHTSVAGRRSCRVVFSTSGVETGNLNVTFLTVLIVSCQSQRQRELWVMFSMTDSGRVH